MEYSEKIFLEYFFSQIVLGVLLVGLVLTPSVATAAVEINELAWMGSSESSSSEWIELKNTGSSSVDLSDWQIVIGDDAPDAISGSIPAGGFFLLERTDDESAPDVSADVTYAGGLSNSGELITLKNASGQTVQTLDFSSGWPAGNNDEKYTMQQKGEGWISAESTPKAANATQDLASTQDTEDTSDEGDRNDNASTSNESTGNGEDADEDEDTSEDDEAEDDHDFSSHSGSASISDFEKELQMKVDAGRDRLATAGSEIIFEGRAQEVGGERINNARFRWNFGDGTIDEGRKVRHVYEFAGSYNVVMNVEKENTQAVDRANVEVSAFDAEITQVKEGKNGFVEVTNKSDHELNFGQFELTSENAKFVFPTDTIVGAGESIRFANAVSGVVEDDRKVELRQPDGTVAFAYNPGKIAGTSTAARTASESSQERSVTVPKMNGAKETLSRVRSELKSIRDELSSEPSENVATEQAPQTSRQDLSSSSHSSTPARAQNQTGRASGETERETLQNTSSKQAQPQNTRTDEESESTGSANSDTIVVEEPQSFWQRVMDFVSF